MVITTKNKPDWLKYKLSKDDHFKEVKDTLKENSLVTVCEEARCPNLSECWNGGTATFMVLGDTCTRGCRFCHIKTKFPAALIDKDEPEKLANAVKKWKLDYVVVTSVDRDDLPDQGSGHFAKCIEKLKEVDVLVEVLIPDFRGDIECLKRVVDAKPDVIAHNIETVKRLQMSKFDSKEEKVKKLQTSVRDPRANYEQSLEVLENVKKLNPKTHTKSSLMLGFGETKEEIEETMKDLRKKDVDIITFGQYLRPSEKQVAVTEYVSPEIFKEYEKLAFKMGFKFSVGGPFVRSSYRAGELFTKYLLQKQEIVQCHV